MKSDRLKKITEKAKTLKPTAVSMAGRLADGLKHSALKFLGLPEKKAKTVVPCDVAPIPPDVKDGELVDAVYRTEKIPLEPKKKVTAMDVFRYFLHNGKVTAAAVFIICLFVSGIVFAVETKKAECFVPAYDEMTDISEGLYIQQYSYNFFDFNSLFLTDDPETEAQTETPLLEKVVVDAGERTTYYSEDVTVSKFFENNFITLGEEDSTDVALTAKLSECGEINISRVGYSIKSEIKYTDFKTETYRVWFLASINSIPAETKGRKGQTRQTFRCKYVDGVLVEKELISSTKLSNPVNAVNYVTYHPEWESHGLDMSYVVDVAEYGSTAYSSQQKNLGECTAMGYQTDYGIAAVSYKNPGKVRMGMWVYIECPGMDFDYGYTYVCDTSHSTNPTWIDLHFDTVAEARKWGRRKVKIYILSGRPDFVLPAERYVRKK